MPESGNQRRWSKACRGSGAGLAAAVEVGASGCQSGSVTSPTSPPREGSGSRSARRPRSLTGSSFLGGARLATVVGDEAGPQPVPETGEGAGRELARETSRAARGDIGHDDMPALVPRETSAEEATPQCVLSRSGSSGEEGAQPGAIVIVCCWSHARPGCRGRHRRKVGGRSPLPRKLAVSQMWRTWCRRRGGGSVPSVTGEGRRGRWRRHTRRDDWPMRAPTGRRAAGECRAGRRGLEQVSDGVWGEWGVTAWPRGCSLCEQPAKARLVITQTNAAAATTTNNNNP